MARRHHAQSNSSHWHTEIETDWNTLALCSDRHFNPWLGDQDLAWRILKLVQTPLRNTSDDERSLSAIGMWLIALAVLISSTGVNGQGKANSHALTLPLNSMDALEIKNFPQDSSPSPGTKTEVTTYRGKRALRMLLDSDGQALAIVKNFYFKDGTIEVDVAGMPRQGAPEDARGFIGVSFRIQEDARQFETVYLRMTNGRAEDQVRRNHSIQYTSEPDFPWYRLRKESPGLYESYVDLDAGAWIKLRIVVRGVKALVYVNSAQQPCLVVNDLKLGARGGQIALYATSDTDAYFSNLKILPAEDQSTQAEKPR